MVPEEKLQQEQRAVRRTALWKMKTAIHRACRRKLPTGDRGAASGGGSTTFLAEAR